MTEWAARKLGEFFHIKHGFAFKGAHFAKEGSQIVLTPGNFKEEGGLKSQGDREKYYAVEPPADFVLKAGDLLVVMTDLTQEARILGSPAFVPEDGRYLHNQRLGKIIGLNESELEEKYLYYLFNWSFVRNQLKATATGATVRHTAPDRIYAVEVPLPDITVQRQIATILSAYDDLIENNLRRIEILEEMAQNLYREWFVKFRFPGHEQVRMVDSPLGKIPEGWEVRGVQDMTTRGKPGKLYNQKTAFREGLVPILDQGRTGTIGYHDDEPGVAPTEDEPVIVFANHTCYQKIVQYPFSTIQNVIPFTPSQNLLRNIYWLHWATKDLIQFNDYKGHWPEFMSKELVVPAADLADQFGEHADQIVRLIYRLEKKNRALRQTRDLLLSKLISGELDVSSLPIAVPEETA